MKFASIATFVMALVLVCFNRVALADWVPANGTKMTVPQLPDQNGMDIDMRIPNVLADDWKCSETGPISDVHFWISVKGNAAAPLDPGVLQQDLGSLYLSIHDNVPALPTGGGEYVPSHPGNLLKGYTIPATGYHVNQNVFTGNQSWFDPGSGEYFPNDHNYYYQVNVPFLADPVIQQLGSIYWLDLSFSTTMLVGWKTSLDTFDARPLTGADDDAVFGLRPPGDPFGTTNWTDLHYPPGHPLAGQSLNLAFVITPEPGSTMLLLVGAMGLGLVRRRRVF